VTDAALGWLDARAEAGNEAPPFLLFLHYFDPHYAYHHHEAHDRSAWYEGELTPQTHFETLLERAGAGALSGEDFRYLSSLHAEEVVFTDEHIGRLLAGMAERGLLDDTLIVFTADHGEEFGSHGSVGHTKTLYDELIDVPLVVSFPGEPALEVVDEVVSTIDILPTLLELYGLPPAERTSGRSLVTLLRDPTARLGRQGVYAEVAYTPEKRRATKIARIERGRKLIYDQDARRYELYDLEADPLEQRDLFDPARFDQERMMHALESFQDFVQGAATADGARLEFDAQELEELRRLGYL
jgi:arylsulfatase A-like enzyme